MNANMGIYVLGYGTKKFNPYDYMFFASHGHFHGEDGVVGFSNLAGTRLFYSKEEAVGFIDELPQWAQSSFTPMEVRDNALLVYAPEQFAKAVRTQIEKSEVTA